MTEDNWNIPYPDDQEIERQAALIVQKALPAKPSFFKAMKGIKNQMGWQYLFPNRSETVFASLLMAVTIFCIWLITSESKSISSSLYGYVFFASPISLLLLTAYAFYEKWEKQTFELEMTMKVTIFQVIAVRILIFSGIALLINMTAALVMALNFDVDFLRIWIISLTGLFGFSSGLLWFVAQGNIWRRTIIFSLSWLFINSAWLLTMNESYLRVVFQLPLVVYIGILLMLIGFFFHTFTKAFTRKQEGLWTC
ncbi:hypothetical protein AC739_15900 [Planococcus glaciei]|uniref:hypothetical protein n=1 Tax=Planococcus glaciei TaxID=459472 RepID=UPI00069EA85B|nr:hypothetical protein [Planococcus glaciei]KOF09206.1 hypothetical protein AC739_15900 [Planococcus glaciei]